MQYADIHIKNPAQISPNIPDSVTNIGNELKIVQVAQDLVTYHVIFWNPIILTNPKKDDTMDMPGKRGDIFSKIPGNTRVAISSVHSRYSPGNKTKGLGAKNEQTEAAV